MKNLFTLIAALFLSYASFGLAAISGTTSVCVGSSTSLYDLDSTGTRSWSSSNPAVATVGSAYGNVTAIAVGTTTITYTLGGSYVTVTFSVDGPMPAAITGASSVCPGGSATLSDATSGGIWSSSTASIATVDVGTGVVTGISSGSTSINYAIGACVASFWFTVDTTGVNPIAGASVVCSGSSITLSDTSGSGGGAWSSSNTSVATVSGGTVLGIATGTANISYTVTGFCGSYSTYQTISVNASSTAGTISGTSTVNVGLTTALSDGVSGGAWTSSNTAIATVNASSGLVTGVSSGTATITYAVTGCTGTVYTAYVISVTTIDGISGYVEFTGPAYYGDVKIWVITYNSGTSMLEAIDSTTVSSSGSGSIYYYQFLGLPTDSLRIKAAQIDSISGTGYIPTYHTSSSYWNSATVFYHTSGTEDINQNINMGYGTVTSGPGFIGGSVLTGANRGTSTSVPAIGLQMLLFNSSGTLLQQTYTNDTGNYTFSNLPVGSYTVHPELINYNSTDYTSISITTAAPNVTAANFIEHTQSHTITPGTAGVANLNPATSSVAAFPNPTTGYLNIQWQEAANDEGTVTISDITGREVHKTAIKMTQGTGVNQIDLSGLTNGLYLISVKSGNINYNSKIQVQH